MPHTGHTPWASAVIHGQSRPLRPAEKVRSSALIHICKAILTPRIFGRPVGIYLSNNRPTIRLTTMDEIGLLASATSELGARQAVSASS